MDIKKQYQIDGSVSITVDGDEVAKVRKSTDWTDTGDWVAEIPKLDYKKFYNNINQAVELTHADLIYFLWKTD